MSTAGLAYNSQTGRPLLSYGELWDERFRQRFLMTSPKSTQSLYLLIAAVTLETGKPYAEAQYLIDNAWPKMTALKPNVLSIFENQSTVMQVAQGEADIAGLFYSKSVYPYTVKGAPIDMCFPREGTFAGINCLTLVKNAPEPELGIAFINWMLDPGVQQGLAEASLAAPTIAGLEFSRMSQNTLPIPKPKWTRWASSVPTGGSSTRYGQSCSKSTTRSLAADRRSPAVSLRLRELTKLFRETRAVDRLSLTLEPGSIVALLGPSGCGKTTTLRMIAGLMKPSAGEIFLDDRPVTRVPAHRRNIGMLFQNYALFPHMTVAENVAFGLEARRIRRDEAAARVAEALRLVQLGGYDQRMPAQLSGGQQQRVALARALVIEPALLLLDEPLGALDKSLRQSMQVELRALQRRLGITTVMVTHDQDEALTIADRIAIMHDGNLEQIGSPAEVYQRPVSRFIASFLGAANFFEGRVDQILGDTARVSLPGGLSVTTPASRPLGSPVTIALRPEAITVEPDTSEHGAASPNTASAIVEQMIYHGFVSHIYLRQKNGNPLIAFQQNQPGASEAVITPGMNVRAWWAETSNHIVRE
jgi:putative spermidine/putrescine transport system ATP-binding protein/spermidine/putrescine transport system ATP-binding protein